MLIEHKQYNKNKIDEQKDLYENVQPKHHPTLITPYEIQMDDEIQNILKQLHKSLWSVIMSRSMCSY